MNQQPGASVLFLIVFVSLPVVIFVINDVLCRRLFMKQYRPWRAAFWLISLVSLGAILLHRALRVSSLDWSPLLHFFIDASYVIVIGQLFLVLFLSAVFLLTWLEKKALGGQGGTANGVSRRSFLGGAASLLALTSFGLAGKGVYEGEKTLTLVQQQVRFPTLPSSLRDFKIAQISDAHLGPFFTLDKLDEALVLVKKAQPDVLVITGDLIDDLDLLTSAMTKIDALSESIPKGIFFCWGNHEYFRNKPRIEAAIRSSKITLLENDSQLLLPGDQPVYLVGVDYPWSKEAVEQTRIRQGDLFKALGKVPKKAFPILLAHHPDFLTEAFAAKIPLTLTGHTHGGQIAILGKSLAPVQYRYMLGMYEEQGCYGYVSAGTGQWLPFRLGCPAEVTLFTFAQA